MGPCDGQVGFFSPSFELPFLFCFLPVFFIFYFFTFFLSFLASTFFPVFFIVFVSFASSSPSFSDGVDGFMVRDAGGDPVDVWLLV